MIPQILYHNTITKLRKIAFKILKCFFNILIINEEIQVSLIKS